MNRVRETRKKKGLTQKELSETSGVSQKDISLIENDMKPQFSLETAKRLAKALGTTVDFLWPD
ncbi:helix-turn-helix transcriptional regulator [Desulfitobacterium hafniense]|uniref:helix-turn-helix transcriptional regulator n=1 Tax=Desulfitobacterium hafniense TaxID=49338 RepID=UPI00059EA15F|nr:helix-turn-helix transcriptional regulator [Desulfitobacterium hafniense]